VGEAGDCEVAFIHVLPVIVGKINRSRKYFELNQSVSRQPLVLLYKIHWISAKIANYFSAESKLTLAACTIERLL
jgi:hypothetical protein